MPAALDVQVICDNHGIHKPRRSRPGVGGIRGSTCTSPDRFSWINQVERWFGFLTNQLFRRGVHQSVQALETDIRAWVVDWNQHPRPCIWTKTAEEILESLAQYCRPISGAGH